MTVKELVERFGLKIAAGENGLDRLVQGGYCGDLLSDVMANAPVGCVWLTIQGHQNIVAVAVLREMAAIIISGDQSPDDDTLHKADSQAIPILMWQRSSFELAGRLHASGVTNPEPEQP